MLLKFHVNGVEQCCLSWSKCTGTRGMDIVMATVSKCIPSHVIEVLGAVALSRASCKPSSCSSRRVCRNPLYAVTILRDRRHHRSQTLKSDEAK